MAFWDINTGKAIKTSRPHEGAVSKIKFYSDGGDNNIIVSAGLTDGLLCVHDMRTNGVIKSDRTHKGAINMLEISDNSFIVTGSADKTLKSTDILGGYQTMAVMNCTDAVYCGKVASNLAIAGCGDGNILAFDIDKGKCLYGYGADPQGSVNAMEFTSDMGALVCGGDSG